MVVLGPAGRNVAAGMTGGLAFFLDAEGSLPSRVNTDSGARIERVAPGPREALLKSLVEEHAKQTNSKRAKALLADWPRSLLRFWAVVPESERLTPVGAAMAISSAKEKGA